MSIYSRDYMREGGPQSPKRPSTWNVVTWLMVINGAVFLFNLISEGRFGNYLGLSLDGLKSFRLWTPLTYQFTHFGTFHFLGNMLGIFFLGRFVSQLIGPQKMLRVYLLGGIFGGLLELVFWILFKQKTLVIGASGSVLTLLAVAATLIPHQRFNLLLFFIIPINMTLRTALWISIGFNVIGLILLLTGQSGGIAIIAHFGGILFGWFYIKYWYRGNQASPSSKKKRFPIRILKDPKKKKKGEVYVSTNVDAILDKINAKGFQSLTAEEKELLEKSSEKLARRNGEFDRGK